MSIVDVYNVQCSNVITKSAKRSAKMFTMIEILHYISFGNGSETLMIKMNTALHEPDEIERETLKKRPNFELNGKNDDRKLMLHKIVHCNSQYFEI